MGVCLAVVEVMDADRLAIYEFAPLTATADLCFRESAQDGQAPWVP